MKTLFLLRHAKADTDTLTATDFDRSLTALGRADATSVGRYIKEKELKIELVVSSLALRARQTTELAVAEMKAPVQMSYDKRIYEASPQQLLEVVSDLDDISKTVLLVGHNPGIEALLKLLTGSNEQLGTASLAKITSKAESWQDLTHGGANLEWVVGPQED